MSGVKNVRAAPFRPPASGFDGRLAAFSGSSPVTDAVSTSRVIRFGIYDLDLSHDSANCQILSAGNYKGYLRSVGNKVSEDLQLPGAIDVCRVSASCHCCSDDVIVGRRGRVRSERKICSQALSSGCPAPVNVKVAVLHYLYGPLITIGRPTGKSNSGSLR